MKYIFRQYLLSTKFRICQCNLQESKERRKRGGEGEGEKEGKREKEGEGVESIVFTMRYNTLSGIR